MEAESTNPLLAVANYGLQAAGAYLYATINPLPGSSWNYSPSADQIFRNNGYTANQASFRDARLARRVHILRERAAQANINPAIIDNNAYWIEMLLRSDTPQVRAMIRKQLGQVGSLILWLIDSLTGSESGIDQLYEGFADPYGTKSGNEAALYAANYAENYIRGQEVYSDGTRDIDAGVMAGGLQELKKFHYNFASAIDADSSKKASRHDLFSGIYNQTEEDGSFRYDALRSSTQAAYIRDLLDNTKDADEKKDLTALLEQATNGTLDVKNLPERLKGLSFEDFGSRNEAKLYHEAVLRDIKQKSGYYQHFEEYAREQKFDLELKKGATDEEKAKYNAERAKLENAFAAKVVDDYRNKAVNERTYKDVEKSSLDEIHQAIEEVNKKWDEGREEEQREVERVAEYSRAMYAVGQASWSELSAEERQQYMDAASSESEAKAMYGAALMNKFAGSYMHRFDFVGASLTGLQIEAGRKAAHLSKEDLTRNAAFMGSILQNKNLLSTTTMASNAWIAAAEQRFGYLNPMEIQEQNQRIVRATESSEGRTLYMFLTQNNLRKGSKLYELQQAIKSGSVTKEQYDYLKKNISSAGIGDFYAAIADETGKKVSVLREEAEYLETNRNMLSGTAQANASNLVTRIAADVFDDNLFTEDNLFTVIQETTDADLASAGISRDRKGAKLLRDLVQSNIQDFRKIVKGDISDKDIKRFSKAGYSNIVEYGKKRREAKKQALQGITNKGKRSLAKRQFEVAAVGAAEMVYNRISGNEAVTRNLTRVASVDASKTSKKQGEAAEYDYLHTRVPAADADLTPVQQIGKLLGKQIPETAGNWLGWLSGFFKTPKASAEGAKSDTGEVGRDMASAFGEEFKKLLGDKGFQDKVAEHLAAILNKVPQTG